MDPAPNSPDLGRIASAYAALTAAQQRLRRLQLRFAIVLVVLVLAYIGVLLLKAKSMYSADQFAAETPKQMERLAPVVGEMVKQAVVKIQPAYATQAKAALEKTWPKLLESAAIEGEALLSKLQTTTEQETKALLERIQQRQMSRIGDKFPQLADGAKREAMLTGLRQQFTEDTADALESMHATYIADVNRVKAELTHFKGNTRYDGMDQEALALEYVHLWLSLIDREVTLQDDEVPHAN